MNDAAAKNLGARALAERVLEREPEGSTAWILAENTFDLLGQIERLEQKMERLRPIIQNSKDAFQWVAYDPDEELAEVYLCGPELLSILVEEGEERAAVLISRMVETAIRQRAAIDRKSVV